MKIAIDGVGRLVVPKALRAELGITGPTELDVSARDGVIELSVAEVAARVEVRDGEPVIVTDGPMRPFDARAGAGRDGPRPALIAPDTSVAIAAAAPWHVAHEAAVAALAAGEPRLIAHVAYETTAALSRMPEGQRLSAEVVLLWLERRFPGAWLGLPATDARKALRAAVGAGIRGGGLYDALIAATAAHHQRTLVSADRRAAAAYAAVGAEVLYLVSAP